jgi:hypothetical protein
MASHPLRSKGPQPVIDELVPSINGQAPEFDAPTIPIHYNDNLQEPTVRINRSATHFLNLENGFPARDRSHSPVRDGRPKLLRAKSDFGPRRESNPQNDETESKASGETEWGIRHGFDTQLASEEWNNMLNSVGVLTRLKLSANNLPRTSSYILQIRSTRRVALLKVQGTYLVYKNGV